MNKTKKAKLLANMFKTYELLVDFLTSEVNQSHMVLMDRDIKFFSREFKIPNFRDVFLCDSFPEQLKDIGSGMLIMDSSYGEGAHLTV